MSTLAVNTITNAAGGNTATINGMTPTAQSLQGFRNRIINGAMVIDQRNNGASVTFNDGVFPVDRWTTVATQTGRGTIQQNAGAVTPPAGFTNYLGFTSSSAYSVLASDAFAIQHRIEGFNIADLGWGSANAQAATLSFWVRSSLTGTFGGSVSNSAQNRSYPFTFAISAANTWEYKTVTIAGDTSGTWLTNNGVGIRLQFGLGAGSTFSAAAGAWNSSTTFSATGAVSVVGTNGATFYITGVQLEAGSVATPFERRPYGTELMLCQRYLQLGIQAGAAANSGLGVAQGGYGVSNNIAILYLNFVVPMRAAPSLEFASIDYNNSSITRTPSTISIGAATGTGCQLTISGTAGDLTLSSVVNLRTSNTTGFLRFNAEL